MSKNYEKLINLWNTASFIVTNGLATKQELHTYNLYSTQDLSKLSKPEYETGLIQALGKLSIFENVSIEIENRKRLKSLWDTACFLAINGLATKQELKVYDKYFSQDLFELTKPENEKELTKTLSTLSIFENVPIKDLQIKALFKIAPDFIDKENKNELEIYELYKNANISLLSDEEKDKIIEILSVCKIRQTKYIQQQSYSGLLEVADKYLKMPKIINLLRTNVATISYEMKYLISNSIHSPDRIKAINSFLNNLKKEYNRHYKDFPNNPTKEEIDTTVQKIVLSISKDIYAATIIFHMANNMSKYCENSENPQIELLYNQYKAIRDYLEPVNSPPKKIDISAAFIDGDCNPDGPKEVENLDLTNIKTKEDYYNQKIALLTLLANASMFESPVKQNKKGKKNRIISETDLSSIELVKLARLSDPPPTNIEEYIDRVIEIADKKIFCKYIPFDEQLKKALTEKEKEEKNGDYKKPLSHKEKELYLIELEHLKDNLSEINGDRLYNYILQEQADSIITKPNDIEGFSIQQVSKKVIAKSNGFFAVFTTLRINSLVDFELQFYDEFRAYMCREGYAAHNSALEGKEFNIMPFFKLKKPSHDESINTEKLKKYCKFLSIMRHNDVKSALAKSVEGDENEKLLVNLVSYAKDQIEIKDCINIDNKKIDFFDYINQIIAFYCATFGNTQANHTEGDHNTLAIKQSTIRETLFSFFKNRIGLSSLAFLIINQYDAIAFSKSIDIDKPFSSSGTYFTISDSDQARKICKEIL